jgi:hypothetical protein
LKIFLQSKYFHIFLLYLNIFLYFSIIIYIFYNLNIILYLCNLNIYFFNLKAWLFASNFKLRDRMSKKSNAQSPPSSALHSLASRSWNLIAHPIQTTSSVGTAVWTRLFPPSNKDPIVVAFRVTLLLAEKMNNDGGGWTQVWKVVFLVSSSYLLIFHYYSYFHYYSNFSLLFSLLFFSNKFYFSS